jgi:acyl-CoA thioester hydrolase
MTPKVFRFPLEVRFRDLDAMGHVNNAVTVTYLEVARTRFWLGHFRHLLGQPSFPFVVAGVLVDYKRPIRLENRVEVELWVSQIGRSSFTLRYRLWADDQLAAEAETVQVHYDYEAGKPKPLEGSLRAALQELLAVEG